MKFILGAQDPEMRSIEEILAKNKIEYAFAGFDQQRSNAARANESNCVLKKTPGRDYLTEDIFRQDQPFAVVECRIPGSTPSLIVDHHEPGDPGFTMPPERYMEGSSLGQVLALFSEKPTDTHRLICAADHCLTQAYQGQCPDVDPSELLFMRAAWKSKILNIGLGEVMDAIMNDVKIIRASIDDSDGIAKIMDPTLIDDYMAEASAYVGVPILYQSMSSSGDLKVMLKGGSPEQISAFMKEQEELGSRVYGNPYRGYAGAYIKRQSLRCAAAKPTFTK